jgi:glycosyltransferase 2 family protein
VLRRTHWGWVLTAAALVPVGLWVRAARWRYLFPPGSNPPGLLAGVLIGYMVNNVLPLRAGEVVRIYVVARRWGHGFWTVLATLVVERVLDGLVIVLVLAVLVLLIPVPTFLQWGALMVFAVDVVAIGVLVMLAAAPDTTRAILVALTRRWPGLQGKALRIFARFGQGLEGIRTPAHVLPLLAWSVAVWLVPVLISWLLFHALDLELPWVAAWALLAFVGLGISIPSAPGYVGVFHVAVVWALRPFDVPQAEAVAYALVLHAVHFIPITVVGWIALVREQVSLTEARHARPAVEEAG